VIYTGYFSHNNHIHMSSCCTGNGSFHTVDEFLKNNSDDKRLCEDLECKKGLCCVQGEFRKEQA
jgi:hypothetical protein